MPCEILIRATDSSSGVMKKGYASVVRDLPWTWGSKEGLPGWIILEITDATASQVDHFMVNWFIKFTHTILQENAVRLRIRVEVDPAVISASDVGKNEIKTEMQEWIENEKGGAMRSISLSELVVDIPKPVDLNALKLEFADEFDAMLDITRYYFTEADVDTVIAAGGHITRTKAQVLALVKDKFLD